MARKPSITSKRSKPQVQEQEFDFEELVVQKLGGIHAAVNVIAEQLKERNDLLRSQMETDVANVEAGAPAAGVLSKLDADAYAALQVSIESRLEALESAVATLGDSQLAVGLVKRLDILEQAARGAETRLAAFETNLSRVLVDLGANTAAPAQNGEPPAPRKRGRPTNEEKAAREAAAKAAVATAAQHVEQPKLPTSPSGTEAAVVAQSMDQKEALHNVGADKPAAPAPVTDAAIQEFFAKNPTAKAADLLRAFPGGSISPNRASAYVEIYGKPAAPAYVPPKPCPGCGVDLNQPNPVHSAACTVVAAAKPTPTPPAPEQKLTVNDVRAVAIQYASKHSKEKLAEMLKKHGATNLSNLPEESYAALVAELNGSM